jgi:protein TonB
VRGDAAGAHAPGPRTSIAEVVLGEGRGELRLRWPIALLLALGTHGSLWLGAPAHRRKWVDAASPPRWYVDLAAPRAPAPPPEAAPPQEPAPPRSRAAGRSTRAPASPPPPAQAAAIVAQQPSPGAPVDLTGEGFVTGTARAYAGGVTAAQGTNEVATRAGDVDPSAQSGVRPTPEDHASAVWLEGRNWSCPWPREADAEQIDEQTVVIRVVVAADGTAESVTVVSDPGHGFGQAAATCATQTRFTPARDHEGTPVRATSPPIRVRFTR